MKTFIEKPRRGEERMRALIGSASELSVLPRLFDDGFLARNLNTISAITHSWPLAFRVSGDSWKGPETKPAGAVLLFFIFFTELIFYMLLELGSGW